MTANITSIQTINIGNVQCRVYATVSPEYLLIQPSARHEDKNGGIDREMQAIANGSDHGFAIAAFNCADWAQSLMPWPDAAVSRETQVGLHAHATLDYVEHALLPWLRSHYGNLPCIIGGYSLGGLFALWAACESNAFHAVAAASPSLWIKDWIGYAMSHQPMAAKVYLSLGDREEHCRNQRMRLIGDCVRRQHDILKAQIGDSHTTLEWNPGGHFGNEAERTARAFAWCMQ